MRKSRAQLFLVFRVDGHLRCKWRQFFWWKFYVSTQTSKDWRGRRGGTTKSRMRSNFCWWWKKKWTVSLKSVASNEVTWRAGGEEERRRAGGPWEGHDAPRRHRSAALQLLFTRGFISLLLVRPFVFGLLLRAYSLVSLSLHVPLGAECYVVWSSQRLHNWPQSAIFQRKKKRNSKLNFEAYYHYVVCGRELIDRSARRLSAVRIRDMLVFCVSFHRIVIINWGSVHLRN